MKLYCMCKITGPGQYKEGKVLDDQVYMAPNRFIPPEKVDGNLSVMLPRSMKNINMGVEQRVPNSSDGKYPNLHPKTKGQVESERKKLREKTRQHFPNVDLYHCTRCGAMVCLEG
ncbi:MAG: hypothetical protein JRJ27_00200 [Deltaproteobacteria bacterium]|nr:hypothetical protein [Deltaproteobacteria bacterium]